MSLENGSIDYADPQYDKLFEEFLQQEEDVILTSTGRDLTGLHKEVSADKETYTAQDEQYYHIGKTEVFRGDLDDIQKAIDTKESITSARITIHGGADELFMSELKGQQVLDAEIAKLQSLKASFSGSNRAMIEQLIAELTDQTNHKNLAAKYPRKDKRSNLGNARLIAARIASGYHEVLTDIYSSLQKSGSHDTVLSYTVDWSKCVIGANGDQWNQRKIHVAISIDTKMDEELQEVQDGDVDLELPVDLDGDGNVDLEHPVEPEPIVVEDPIDGSPLIDQAPEVIDIEACKAELIKSYGLIRMVQGLRYSFASSPKFIVHGSDREVLQVRDKSSEDVVLELGLYTDGPNKGLAFVGLGDDIYEVQEHGTVLDYSNLAKDHVFDSIVSDLKRRKQNVSVLVNQPPEEVSVADVEFYSGEKEVIIHFANSTGDVVTAAGHPELFDQDSQGNYFPNIVKIQAYYDRQGLDVEFVVPSQTYENGATLTDFALDNGKFAGEYQDLERLKQEKKGLLITYPDGRMEFTHTDEIQTWTSIPAGVDIAMLGSVKRPGKNINENLLGTSSPNRFLVQKQDGSVELLVLYGGKEEQKKFLDNPGYVRALYLDVAGNNGQINGYWTQKDGKLVYGNTGTGDVLRDGKVPTEVVKGNMPSLLIMTKPQKKKEEAISIATKGADVIKNTPLPLSPDLKKVDVPSRQEEKPILLEIKGSGIVDNAVHGLDPDLNKVDVPFVKMESVPELDPIVASLYANLGDENLQKLHANLLILPNTKLLDALRDEDTTLIVDQLLLISDATTRMDLMELLFSLELKDRLSGIGMRQLMNGLQQVQDVALKKQLMYALFVGDTYGAMRLLGMKKGSEYSTNTITDVYKLNHIFLKNLAERRNRIFHSWFDILSGNILLSNEFGQKGAMPADVKSTYMMFVSDGIRGQIKDTLPSQNIPSRKIQSQGNYAIISKTDGHMYLFDGDHRLLSRKSVLLGKDRSDAPFKVHDYPVKNDAGQVVNFNPPPRTPRGLYSVEARGPKTKIGRYMQFFPKDNQIDYGPLNKNGDRKWTIGIHELYSDAYAKRDAAIRSSNVQDKFLSNGCINMHNDYYAEVWDHLVIGSSVYVS